MMVEREQPDGAPRRVLLVGWDAADWQMIGPLVERGLMPTLADLLGRGAHGNLASLRPMLSPILWNSIATGKRAGEHGVLGFTEPDPDGHGIRPSASTSRRCKALWNILSQCGLRSNVVGWYASHPAEPIAGVAVSNQFEVFQPQGDQITPPPPGSVYPAELADELAPLRVRPREIDASAILPFIPSAAELVAKGGQRVAKLQQMLAQTATVHAVATHLMANTEWDFTAVYYEGIDRFGHEYMEFHPPRMPQVAEADFDAYRDCMAGIYRFHDMMLQTLLTLAGEDTAVIVMSDHGYYSNHLRPDPREGMAGPVDWHRPFGMLAAAGPGVAPKAKLYGASLLDIAPTVLHLLGLPAGYDMPGRVLAEMLALESEPRRIETWEEIEGPDGMHDQHLRVDPAEAREALQQLVDLGYIDAPTEDADHTLRSTVAHNQLALAQSLADARQFAAAVETLDTMDQELADASAVRVLLASCLIGVGDTARARTLLEAMAAEEAQTPRGRLMLGVIEFAEGNPERALEHLEQALAADVRLPGLHNKLGAVYLAVRRYPDAIQAFRLALETDPENSIALEGLARAELERGEPQAALEHGLAAAELTHHFPRVHLTIGRALLALGDSEGAIEALELAVKQAPRLTDAHRALSRAYRAAGLADKARNSELRSKSIVS